MARFVLTEENPCVADMCDDDLLRYSFHKDRAVRLVAGYLAFVATDPNLSNRGILEEKIQTDTLRRRASCLWFFAVWVLERDAINVYVPWKTTVNAIVHKYAVQEDLGTSTHEKGYMGVPEINLLFCWLLRQVKNTSYHKQNYVAWAMALVTGIRPSSMASPKEYKRKEDRVGMHLRWSDITFFPNLNGHGLTVDVHVRWIKGRRDPHADQAKKYKTAHFLIGSCERTENLLCDLPWLLLVLGFERGLFTESPSLDDLLASPLHKLSQDSIVSQQPIFLAHKTQNCSELDVDVGLKANAFTESLQRACREVGIFRRVSMYAFRREALTSFARNATTDMAREVALHKPGGGDLFGKYDYGFGDVDLSPIRFSPTETRNRIRELLESPALDRLMTYTKQEEYQEVKNLLVKDTNVIEFGKALKILLTTLTRKFNSGGDGETVAAVSKTLEPFSTSKADSSNFILPFDDVENPQHWIDHVETITDGSYAHEYLQQFLATRKQMKVYTRRRIRKQCQTERVTIMKERTQNQLLKEKEMLAELPSSILGTKDNHQKRNLNLQNPFGDTLKKRPKRYHQWPEKENDSNAADSDSEYDLSAEEETEITRVEDNLIDSIPDGATVEVAALDEGAVADEGLDSNKKEKDIQRLRRDLISKWMKIRDMTTGKQSCRICLGNPASEIIKTCSCVAFTNRHIQSATHTKTFFEEYLKFCYKDDHYVCRRCGKVYIQSGSLKTHLKQHHGKLVRHLNSKYQL